MRWPIRVQILLPFAATLALAVAVIAVTSSWLAARRQERETLGQLQRVVETLGQVRFPYTAAVLDQMRGLSGAEFIAFDDGGVIASTLAKASAIEGLAAVPLSGDMDSLTRSRPIDVAGESYFSARVRSVGPTSLLVLYPERRWTDARREAAWPPLAVGAATAAVMVGVSAWLSRRLGRRIDAARAVIARIADGQFEPSVAAPPNDELRDLVLSANRLSDQLRGMRETIRQTERVRLLAQLAGGLAHQLRNSLTGARMAVQLHQRRCPAGSRDEGLEVALLQLSLTEEQVKGLLASGRREEASPARGLLGDLLHEVERLVDPSCRHARVRWSCTVAADAAETTVDSFARLRAALLNLVLNGIEATGPGGEVGVSAERCGDEVLVEVSDSGPGPPDGLRDSLFEPFVTSKPEGIGLGLALARQVVEELGGSLAWARRETLTVFSLTLPIGETVAARSSPGEDLASLTKGSP